MDHQEMGFKPLSAMSEFVTRIVYRRSDSAMSVYWEGNDPCWVNFSTQEPRRWLVLGNECAAMCFIQFIETLAYVHTGGADLSTRTLRFARNEAESRGEYIVYDSLDRADILSERDDRYDDHNHDREYVFNIEDGTSTYKDVEPSV